MAETLCILGVGILMFAAHAAESKEAELELFDAYDRPDLPAAEWPKLPEIIRRTHSWNTLPRYLAISKNQKRSGKWTEEELSALASHAVLQLSTPTDPVRGKGNPELAAELKKRNPDIIILGYRNLALDYGGFDGPTFKAHPDWYLKDKRTGRYTVHGKTGNRSRRPVFDIRIPEVREWWISDISRQCKLPDFDGVLIDAFAKAITPWGPRVNATGRSREELLEANKALHLLLKENIRRNGEEGTMVGNALRSVFKDGLKSYVDAYLHGTYLEAIEQKSAVLYSVHLAHLIDTCIQIQNEGGQKIMCIALNPDFPPKPLEDGKQEGGTKVHMYDEATSADFKSLDSEGKIRRMREAFEYKLALGLILATNYAYFGYASTHIASGPVPLWAPDYPEFKKRLGPPQGAAVKTGEYAYERRYRYASVHLDIATRNGKVVWQ